MTLEVVPFDQSVPCRFCDKEALLIMWEPDQEMADEYGFFFVSLCLEHATEPIEETV